MAVTPGFFRSGLMAGGFRSYARFQECGVPEIWSEIRPMRSLTRLQAYGQLRHYLADAHIFGHHWFSDGRVVGYAEMFVSGRQTAFGEKAPALSRLLLSNRRGHRRARQLDV